ncbi:MAG: sugar phosphate nucleotidyltransferase [Candidatus Gracilibacteria bacterium]|jgi:mannose-1-phosphate guanylyltransferase
MKAVILAGGGGTRLWPLSTEKVPKQFQKLVSNRTMFEETVDRLNFLKPKDIYVAINKEHHKIIRKLAPKIPKENILIEPALRDTCSAIGLATAIIAKKYPNEVIAIIYADHLIKNTKMFQQKLKLAEKIAQKENTLNIIEVKASSPHTGYGYIKLGKLLDKSNQVYEIDRFVEKPSLKKAQEYVKSGKHLWNTGIYVWKAKTLLAEYAKHQPGIYGKLMEMVKNPAKIKNLYPTLPKISLDYAIMEKTTTKKIRIIKSDKLGWSDVGNFEAIFNELAKSKKQNILRGKVKLLECEGCLIYSDTKKTIKALGLKDLVIVDTPDGLLICKKDQSKRIKEIV